MFSLRCKPAGKVWEAFKEMGNFWISSTEASALLFASHYGSRRALWDKKVRRTKRKFHNNPAILHGQKFEELALEKGKKLVEDYRSENIEWKRPSMVKDPWSVFSCSPDQLAKDFGLEVKAPWRRALPEKKEDILNDYLLQCFVCAHVCKVAFWYLYYVDVNVEPHAQVLFRVNSNNEIWEELKKKGEEFVDLLEAGDEKSGRRVKKKLDVEYWEHLKKQLLEGVSRVSC